MRVVIPLTSHLLDKMFILLPFFPNLPSLYFTLIWRPFFLASLRTLKRLKRTFIDSCQPIYPPSTICFHITLFLTVNINELTMLLFKANPPIVILDVISLCIIQNILSTMFSSIFSNYSSLLDHFPQNINMLFLYHLKTNKQTSHDVSSSAGYHSNYLFLWTSFNYRPFL